ncbi:MAG: phBC6A51 family helix-turn-helix protein [Candidatus Moranbacteria bacterium]|nr:phBC6A51 family helix-turn-helix protein [Candidatus Moranbacteria bacterium]
MKKDRAKILFLEQLRKIPIIQVACEKVGVARSSVYRWRDEDEKFRQSLEEALSEGEALINDMSESQLISLIRDKSYQAISFWLRHRHQKFRERVEVTANIQSQDVLTPEQEEIVREALRLSSVNQITTQSYEQQKDNNPGVSGGDDQGSKSQSGNH